MAADITNQPNLPGGGDLMEDHRRYYLDIVVPLYKAIIGGDYLAAKAILDVHSNLVACSITEKREMPLHVAAAAPSIELVRYLVDMMDVDILELQDEDGNTAFCLAAIAGNIEMLRIMASKNPRLPSIHGSRNMMPLTLAAFHGNQRNVVVFLYRLSDKMRDCPRHHVLLSLLSCVEADLFDVALLILEDKKDLGVEDFGYHLLNALARKPKAFQEHILSSTLIQSIKIWFPRSTRPTSNEINCAVPLLKVIWTRIKIEPVSIVNKILRGSCFIDGSVRTYPARVLFIAAKMGNKNFLAELSREYPEVLRKIDDNGQSIFHVSVAHRQWDTFGLLYEIGPMKDQITPMVDREGNNILHLVGLLLKENTNDDNKLPTPFGYFEELYWYKEVEKVLPRPYKDVKNNNGLTPKELFRKCHQELGSKCVDGIHNTITQSMVVSVLVCTIGFSVVYQIPGGFDENGLPILLHDNFFLAYIAFNVLSFVFSTFSILIFLSIILSRNKVKAEVLIGRWMNGQISVVLSITTLAIAFVISFFALYRQSYHGIIPYLVLTYASLFFTVGLYPSSELYKDAIYAAFGMSVTKFRPKTT